MKKIILIIKYCIILLIILSSFCFAENSKELSRNTYILNVRTKKIHTIDCQFVTRMSNKNKKEVSDTLENLYKQKYTICKQCGAGIKKNGINQIVDRLLYSNLYKEIELPIATRTDYINAINLISEWYVNNIPTYASVLQEETIEDYYGDYKNYKEYNLINKDYANVYKVVTSDDTGNYIDDLKDKESILRANENAVISYIKNFLKIEFKSRIAFYPCNLINDKVGDDCVRLMFAVFSNLEDNFVKKYKILSKHTLSNTNSTLMANDIKNIPYAFLNIGFEIYDQNECPVYVNNDKIPEGYINKIDKNFKLKKGDILVRPGHIHFYLGDGEDNNAENFGWGRVYRSFPQKYDIKVVSKNNKQLIKLTNNKNNEEYYTRVYRYVGKNIGGE